MLLSLTEDTELKLETFPCLRDSVCFSFGGHHYFKPRTDAGAVTTSHGIGIPLEGGRIFPTEHRHCLLADSLESCLSTALQLGIYLFLIIILL